MQEVTSALKLLGHNMSPGVVKAAKHADEQKPWNWYHFAIAWQCQLNGLWVAILFNIFDLCTMCGTLGMETILQLLGFCGPIQNILVQKMRGMGIIHQFEKLCFSII
jgi:hypothetical protein